MPTFFRNQQTTSSTTQHVQGRHQNEAPSEVIKSRKRTRSGHQQNQSHEEESIEKTERRKTNEKITNTKRMSVQTEMEKTINTEKEDDLSPKSEENTSPSPK